MKININDTPYSFPEKLTMEQWAYLTEKIEWSDNSEWVRVIHYLTGAPLFFLERAEEETLALAAGFIIAQLNERTEVKIKSFEELTFGEFVDLDIYLHMGVHKNWKAILEVLQVDAKTHSEGVWAIEQFSRWRMYIYRQYKKLFEIEDSASGETESDEKLDPLAAARSWYQIIVSLADNDLLKIDAVTDQPLKKTLNFMAYQKEKQIEENMRKLQEQRKYDLSINRRSR